MWELFSTMSFRVSILQVLTVPLLLLAGNGCVKQEVQLPGFGTDPDTVRIDATVGILTRSNPLGTVDEQAQFNVGDKIAVVHTSANKLVDYTYNGTSWIPDGDDYLVWQTDGSNAFSLRYPADGWATCNLEKDQSTLEALSKSDLMWKDVTVDKVPSDKRLAVTLERQRSLITVVIDDFGDEFDADDAKVTDLKLHLWDGAPGGYEVNPVTPYIRDAKGVRQMKGSVGLTGYTYTAIGRNDCLYVDYKQQIIPFIDLTVAGKVLTVANPAPMEPGKHYTYRLTIGKETVKIAGVTVEEWTEGAIADDNYRADDPLIYSEWGGPEDIATAYAGGDGTQGNPYKIATAAQLAFMAKQVNSGQYSEYSTTYFRLDADIDLMGHPWTPIGTGSKYFNGDFDAGDHTIINLKVADVENAGLFGSITGAKVQNLHIRNASIDSKGNGNDTCSGVIAGLCSFRGIISNCSVEDALVSGECHTGGIVGQLHDGEISNCTAVVNCITRLGLYDSNCGGIVGYFFGGKISGCAVRGEVKGEARSSGGIVGELRDGEITDCVSYANVDLGSIFTTVYPITCNVGGFIGKCFVSDYVTVKTSSISGDNRVYGRVSIAEGLDAHGGTINVGGFVGYAGNIDARVSFQGNIAASQPSSGTSLNAGAVIGYLDDKVTMVGTCSAANASSLPIIGAKKDGVDDTRIDITVL